MWKYANAQWAFYPNGGGISTRGAVTPAWFYNRPFSGQLEVTFFITFFITASDLEVTFYLLLLRNKFSGAQFWSGFFAKAKKCFNEVVGLLAGSAAR